MKLTPKQLLAVSTQRSLLLRQERAGLARRMHDEVSQKLTVLNLELSLMAMQPTALKGPKWKQKVEHLAELVTGLSQTVREITTQLRPKVLDEFGLVAALQWYAKRFPAPFLCDICCPHGDVNLPSEVASELFTGIQEAVSDLFIHPENTQLSIRVQVIGKDIEIRLVGKETAQRTRKRAAARNLAILSLQERLLHIGADVRVKRLADGQTAVILYVASVIPKTKSKTQLSAGSQCCGSVHNFGKSPSYGKGVDC